MWMVLLYFNRKTASKRHHTIATHKQPLLWAEVKLATTCEWTGAGVEFWHVMKVFEDSLLEYLNIKCTRCKSKIKKINFPPLL